MKKLYFVAFLLIFIIVSCQRIETIDAELASPNSPDDKQTIEIVTRDSKPTILGKQLNNPYSTENMQAALDLLIDSLSVENNTGVTKAEAEMVEITPTDWYVRMVATDSVSSQALVSDSTLSLFDHRIDQEVKDYGDYYRDFEGLPDTLYQWWYCRVPIDYQPHNGVRMELLEELFIPEHSPYYGEETTCSDVSTRLASGKVIGKNMSLCLKIASFYLTGNYEQIRQTPEQKQKIETRLTYHEERRFWFLWWSWIETKWYSRPEGYVKFETSKGLKPLPYARIRVARWFEEDVMYTQSNGYYIGGKAWEHIGWFNNLEYQVWFTGRNGYAYWDQTHFIGVAYYNAGVHNPDGHSLTFYRNSHFWGKI